MRNFLFHDFGIGVGNSLCKEFLNLRSTQDLLVDSTCWVFSQSLPNTFIFSRFCCARNVLEIAQSYLKITINPYLHTYTQILVILYQPAP